MCSWKNKLKIMLQTWQINHLVRIPNTWWKGWCQPWSSCEPQPSENAASVTPGPQQLDNDEIDVWQPLTGERQPICLSVATERWMTLQPCASGNIQSAAPSWKAHHHPSPACRSISWLVDWSWRLLWINHYVSSEWSEPHSDKGWNWPLSLNNSDEMQFFN